MAQKIGDQDGIKAAMNRLRDLDPGGTLLKKGADGKWPDLSTLTAPLDQWKAWDKWQRTQQILVDDHDAANPTPPGPDIEEPPPSSDTSDAKARLFLAQNPLDCLAAPPWMIPVCTADHGYRSFYSPDVIAQLRSYFGHVEAWCDCRVESGYHEGQGTGYDEAVKMTQELGLDPPAWGQCETQMEWDNAYAGGARRMVGKISEEVCNAGEGGRLEKVAAGEVHLSVELYCNCMPWVVPDWRGANAGVGGSCIACYADATPCNYTPVAWYRERGWYVPKQDSVYAVGLTSDDWAALW